MSRSASVGGSSAVSGGLPVSPWLRPRVPGGAGPRAAGAGCAGAVAAMRWPSTAASQRSASGREEQTGAASAAPMQVSPFIIHGLDVGQFLKDLEGMPDHNR